MPAPRTQIAPRLNPPEQHEDKNDDQDGAEDTDATVTEAVPVAAEPTTEAAEQKDDEDDNEDGPERHDSCSLSLTEPEVVRVSDVVDGRLGCLGGSECRAHQRRNGLRASLSHDGRTMIVDRALADTEISGDVLAWKAGQDEVEDLPLTYRQTGDACRIRLAWCRQPSVVMRLITLVLDGGKKLFASERHFDEIHRTGLHRLDRRRHT